MAQRDAPHLKSLTLKNHLVAGRINLNPLHLVWQLRVKVSQMVLQNLPKWAWRKDLERHLTTTKPQCREEWKEPENMVSVQVRDKYRAKL